MQAFIFGAVAALCVWSVAEGRLNRWVAWGAVVSAGMLFRVAGRF